MVVVVLIFLPGYGPPGGSGSGFRDGGFPRFGPVPAGLIRRIESGPLTRPPRRR